MVHLEFTLCEQTGALAKDGVCPIHNGDGCLAQFHNTSQEQKYHTEGPVAVRLPFSVYEIRNLCALFATIMPHRYKVEGVKYNPVSSFNSGDWCGVVGDRFIEAGEKLGVTPYDGNRLPTTYIKEIMQRVSFETGGTFKEG